MDPAHHSLSSHKNPSMLGGQPPFSHSQHVGRSHGSSVSFSNQIQHNNQAPNMINKYETQTQMASDKLHPIRGDPAMLSQPIDIHLDHARDTVPVKNQKMFRNVASIEIAELKDALAYAERLLAKSLEEKEALQ